MCLGSTLVPVQYCTSCSSFGYLSAAVACVDDSRSNKRAEWAKASRRRKLQKKASVKKWHFLCRACWSWDRRKTCNHTAESRLAWKLLMDTCTARYGFRPVPVSELSAASWLSPSSSFQWLWKIFAWFGRVSDGFGQKVGFKDIIIHMVTEKWHEIISPNRCWANPSVLTFKNRLLCRLVKLFTVATNSSLIYLEKTRFEFRLDFINGKNWSLWCSCHFRSGRWPGQRGLNEPGRESKNVSAGQCWSVVRPVTKYWKYSCGSSR